MSHGKTGRTATVRRCIIVWLLLAVAVFCNSAYRSRQISRLLGKDVVALIRSAKTVEVFQALHYYWESTGRFETPADPMQKVGEPRKLDPEDEKEIRRLLLNPRNYSQEMLGAVNGTWTPETVVRFADEKSEAEIVFSMSNCTAILKTPTGGEKALCFLPMERELALLVGTVRP